LRQDGRLVHRKGTHNVKNLAENQTKIGCAAYTLMGNGTESTCAYDRKREGVPAMLFTAHIDNIMEAPK